MHSRSRFIRLFHFLGDLFLLNFSFVISYIIQGGEVETLFKKPYLSIFLFFNLSWLIIVSVLKMYEIYRVTRIERIILNLIKAIALHVLFISTIIVVVEAYFVPRKHLLYAYLFLSVLLITWRIFFITVLKWYRKSGGNYRRAIIAGAGPVGITLYDFLVSDQSFGYRFLGFFDDNPEESRKPELIMGSIDDIKKFAVENQIDEIYSALPYYAGEKIRDLMKFADNRMIRFKIIPDFMRYMPKKVHLDFYGNIPVIINRKEPLESYRNRVLKRTFDIFFSGAVILFVLPPLTLILGTLIKLESKGPVFYKQNRGGRKYKKFKVWKYRSMTTLDSDNDYKQATKEDVRITRIGKFMRKTNLDEMPQFINVFLGNMSVVGPRPHPLKLNEQYYELIDKYMVRHLVKPGITGLAQVRGYRGETKDPIEMEKRVRADVYYLENWSFLLDLKIIFLTIRNMLKGEENAV